MNKKYILGLISILLISLVLSACTSDADIKADADAKANVDTKTDVKADTKVDVETNVDANINANDEVYINGKLLTQAQIQMLTETYGQAPVPGRYWYDARSGFYGIWKGPTLGVLQAGHDFGTLSPDASNGDTGVFFNGRELSRADVQVFESIFGVPLVPGRAWLDAEGNVGTEGSDVPIANLYLAYQQRVRAGSGSSSGTNYGSGYGSSGDNYWAGNFGSAGNEEGGFGYVMVDGVSVTYGG